MQKARFISSDLRFQIQYETLDGTWKVWDRGEMVAERDSETEALNVVKSIKEKE